MRHLLLSALLLLPISVHATPVTIDFSVNGGPVGPLAGVVADGSFDFGGSLFPPGGGLLNEAGLLSDLDFSWNGISYTASTANTGALGVLTSGVIVAVFGTDCSDGPCSAGPVPNSWFVSAGTTGRPGTFAYEADGRVFTGSATMTRAPIPVPEPNTMALMGLALAVIGRWYVIRSGSRQARGGEAPQS